MSPCEPAQDIADGPTGDAENRSQLSLGEPLASQLSQAPDLDSREPGVPMGLAVGMPTLAPHVAQIVSLGSEKKVRRIAAGRVIAVVANNKPSWDLTVGEDPRVSMSLNRGPVWPEHAVATLVAASLLPFPALLRRTAADAKPEPLLGRKPLLAHPSPVVARARISGGAVATVGLAPVFAEARRSERIQALLLAALATPLRDLYRRIVHWVTSSGPVPGDVSRAGTFAWSVP